MLNRTQTTSPAFLAAADAVLDGEPQINPYPEGSGDAELWAQGQAWALSIKAVEARQNWELAARQRRLVRSGQANHPEADDPPD